MKKLLILSIWILGACAGADKQVDAVLEKEEVDPKTELTEKIAFLENRVYEGAQPPLISDLNELMNSYKSFGDLDPKDQNAPEYYFKAAELAQAMGNNNEAIVIHKKIYEDYPEFDKRVTSLFFVAFINHYFLKDYPQAKSYYEKVVELYPGTQEAMDSEASIPLIGMSDEEIIKSFEEKNKVN